MIKRTSFYAEEDLLKDLKQIALDYDCKVNDLLLIGASFITTNSKDNQSLLTQLVNQFKNQ